MPPLVSPVITTAVAVAVDVVDLAVDGVEVAAVDVVALEVDVVEVAAVDVVVAVAASEAVVRAMRMR
jgi:hypothetical protein